MKVLGVINGKGGVGKTTTAVNLSDLLATKGEKVLLVDTDPQGSATLWTGRGEKKSFETTKETDTTMLEQLRNVPGFDVIVVDSPPRLDSIGVNTVAKACDYIILPTPPSFLDTAALIDTTRTIIHPLKVKYRVLLTKVDPRSINEALEAQSAFLEAGTPVFHAFVRSYKSHERAPITGKSIAKMIGDNADKGLEDYKRVLEEVYREW